MLVIRKVLAKSNRLDTNYREGLNQIFLFLLRSSKRIDVIRRNSILVWAPHAIRKVFPIFPSLTFTSDSLVEFVIRRFSWASHCVEASITFNSTLHFGWLSVQLAACMAHFHCYHWEWIVCRWNSFNRHSQTALTFATICFVAKPLSWLLKTGSVEYSASWWDGPVSTTERERDGYFGVLFCWPILSIGVAWWSSVES